MQLQDNRKKPTTALPRWLPNWICDQRRHNRSGSSQGSAHHRVLRFRNVKQSDRTWLVGEENVSSASILPLHPFGGSRMPVKHKSKIPSSVPFEVFVPSHSSPYQSSAWNRAHHGHTEEQRDCSETSQSERSLDGSLLDGTVLELLWHADVEVQARMQAIEQLSLMMGAAHPDVHLSLKYLGRHLCKLGDYQSALAIKNQMMALHQSMTDQRF